MVTFVHHRVADLHGGDRLRVAAFSKARDHCPSARLSQYNTACSKSSGNLRLHDHTTGSKEAVCYTKGRSLYYTTSRKEAEQ